MGRKPNYSFERHQREKAKAAKKAAKAAAKAAKAAKPDGDASTTTEPPAPVGERRQGID